MPPPLDLRREGRLLVAAAMLLTRLPMPRVELDPDWLPRSAKYLPLVGCAVGGVSAAVLLAASAIWPRPIPDLLALAAAILLTGAFHEDGLADTFDGLGGWSRAERLAIMKDSRLGSFGALALFAALALQAAALASLPAAAAAAALVAAGAGQRAAAITLAARQPYAADPAESKVAGPTGGASGGELAIGWGWAALAALPLVMLEPARGTAGLALGCGAASALAAAVCRRLGGYTGDVLGATAMAFSTGFLLGAAAGWG